MLSLPNYRNLPVSTSHYMISDCLCGTLIIPVVVKECNLAQSLSQPLPIRHHSFLKPFATKPSTTHSFHMVDQSGTWPPNFNLYICSATYSWCGLLWRLCIGGTG